MVHETANLNTSGINLQPLPFLITKMRSNDLINLFMILIQLLTFLICQHFRNDRIQIDRNICDRFKVQELSIFILRTFSYEKFILGTNTVASLDIDNRFVCNYKSIHQRSLFFFTD